jgi:protein-tyrosine-phosphatase
MAASRGITGVRFASAGTGATEGAPPTDAAILIGIERDVDLSSHRARTLTPEMIDGDTLVLALAMSHLTVLHALSSSTNVYLLDEYATHGDRHRSVSDPFGGDLADYRAAADDIESMLRGALDRIASEGASQRR